MKILRRHETIALLSGFIFALGLAIAGMTDPHRVQSFLDFSSSQWDPSLAWTLGGAVAVYALAQRWIDRRRKTLFNEAYHPPHARAIDTKLILGAALFGTGWGLAGLCPGPALSRLATPALPIFVFVTAMLAGLRLGDWLGRQPISFRVR
ncbi:MAG: YeeE/YedE family protein [Bdellovibrionales bacterium]|nr:YeeE/YedE family protein [Bdellovibrionales bacterium]